MKIFDIPEDSRPRERFLSFGSESLSDAELLAIILRTGSKQENVIDMSNKIISTFTLEKLFSCSINELEQINGIGKTKAMQILAMAELPKRKELQKNKKKKIKQTKDVFDMFHPLLKDKTQEYFYIIMLGVNNKILGTEKISTGILDSIIIHPREIFKPAIRNSSSKIILVHNHPSGDPTPSDEDLDMTRNLIEAGTLVGIEVLDHVIIGDENHWSYVNQ